MGLQEAAVDDAAGHGGDVDDGALAARQHDPRLGLATEHHPGEVDVEHALPALQFQLLGRLGVGDAGAVDRETQGTELGLGTGHGGFQIGGAGHRPFQGQGAAAVGLDPRDGTGEVAAAGQVEAGHLGAGFGQSDGDGLADATAGTGDEGGLAAEIEETHGKTPSQAVASSITATGVACSRSRMPICWPRLITMTRCDRPRTSSRSELTTITAMPVAASSAITW